LEYIYCLWIFILFWWKSDYFGGNWKNRVKRGDFDMVLEEDLDMTLGEHVPVLIGGI
jgi:hypothetical protein